MKNPPALHCFVTLIGLLALTAMVASGQGKAGTEAQIPTIHFDNIPLTTGIENLARQAEMNYSVSPLVPDPAVTKTWKNVAPRTALTNLLAEHKLFLIESPATGVTVISTTNRIATPVDPKWIAADTNQPIPLIQFSSAPMNIVFTQLARQSKMAVDVSPQLDAMVTFRWEKLKPRQSIAALCETYNLVLSTNATPGGIRIAPK